MKEPQFEPLFFTPRSVNKMCQQAQDFYAEIKRRRTVRDYDHRPVPHEVIEYAIGAAGTAPSGANMQPWYFVVITDADIKQQIRAAAEQEEREFYQHRASEQWLQALAPLGTDEHKPFLQEAPVLIVIFLKKFTFDSDGNKFKNYYTAESVGIATGMLITALHLAGLATLTHTPSPMKFLNKILNRPDDERPYLILVTGYPASDAKVPVISKQPLENIVTFI